MPEMLYYLKLPFESIYLFLYLWLSIFRTIYRKIVPLPPKSIENQVILITGTSRGIGREIAVYLAKHYASVKLILWDVDQTGNKKTAELVTRLGGEAKCYTVDISDRIAVETTAAKVVKEVGDPQIVIQNAGIAGVGTIFEQSPEVIEKTIQINLTAHFWILRTFLPKMIEKNSGHIVTMSSLVTSGCLRYAAPYTASKYGIRGYLKALRSELRACPQPTDNIKFTTVSPYWTNTPLVSRVRLNMRLKSLEQKMHPSTVAKSTIEGMRRNEEHVVVPWDMEIPIYVLNLFPQSFINKVEDWLAQDSTYVKEE